MPNRDGRGPRKRSPRPSRRKGGLKKGKCKYITGGRYEINY